MKFFFNLYQKVRPFKDVPLPLSLGRWKIENCQVQMSKKIDLSNEDHCGPCGQYVLEKLTKEENVVKKSMEREPITKGKIKPL
jgi:hypothetical protein